MKPPPLGPGLLMRALLPADAEECVAGDLAEAWNSGQLSRSTDWRLALASIVQVIWSQLTARNTRPASKGGPPLRVTSMHAMLHDLRHAARLLRHNAGFTVTAAGTLALGIGVTTAIFTIVHVLLFEPLPYADSRRISLVRAWSNQSHSLGFSMSVPEMLDLKRDATTFEDVLAYAYWSANISGRLHDSRLYSVADA